MMINFFKRISGKPKPKPEPKLIRCPPREMVQVKYCQGRFGDICPNASKYKICTGKDVNG